MKHQLTRGLLLLLIGIPALLSLVSLLAPLIEVGGWPRAANRLYFLLSHVCHQMPSRSLWVFGAPFGVCSRSLFLYLAFVGTGLFIVRFRWCLPWQKSLLLLMPILIDGLTQLAGWRESTNLLRVLTGGLGGIGLTGLLIPTSLRAVAVSADGPEGVWCLSNLKRVIAGLTLVAFAGATLPYGTATAQSKITIPEGTRVAVKSLEGVSSESAKMGQTIRFEVVRDVVVNSKVVIKAGAPAIGEVLKAESKRAVGREGTLLVGIRYATAVDGTQVPLRASLEEKGEERFGLSIALGVVLCPLFLLMKGKEAEIPAGTEYTVFVDRPIEVTVEGV
jgi:uncharacterized membrane protein